MSSLGIDSLTIGVSKAGIQDYKEKLKMNLLTKCIEALDNDIKDVTAVIDAGWQGVSKDRFLKLLEGQVAVVKQDIQDEYNDLEARIEEIAVNYLKQDEGLISE